MHWLLTDEDDPQALRIQHWKAFIGSRVHRCHFGPCSGEERGELARYPSKTACRVMIVTGIYFPTVVIIAQSSLREYKHEQIEPTQADRAKADQGKIAADTRNRRVPHHETRRPHLGLSNPGRSLEGLKRILKLCCEYNCKIKMAG